MTIDARSVTRWHRVGASQRDTQVLIPDLQLKSPLNGSHGHWGVKARERKRQREIVGLVCAVPLAEYRRALAKGYVSRVVILIERIAPRRLDGDNLQAACKAVRDGITDALGLRDDSDPRLAWGYGQARGNPNETSVRITVRGEV